MRTAICTINDRVYEAAGFDQDRHFENIKTSMICPECKAPAFFRGVTQNGRCAIRFFWTVNPVLTGQQIRN